MCRMYDPNIKQHNHLINQNFWDINEWSKTKVKVVSDHYVQRRGHSLLFSIFYANYLFDDETSISLSLLNHDNSLDYNSTISKMIT